MQRSLDLTCRGRSDQPPLHRLPGNDPCPMGQTASWRSPTGLLAGVRLAAGSSACVARPSLPGVGEVSVKGESTFPKDMQVEAIQERVQGKPATGDHKAGINWIKNEVTSGTNAHYILFLHLAPSAN